MLMRTRWRWSLVVVLGGLTLGGCSLSGETQQDDEKESHYVLGKSRVNAMDYAGAAEAFEEALEVSPHSAPAHFQLAWLYENELNDPAAAIYHYQEYLKLDPKAGNPDVIRQRIYACKQKLVIDVMQLPSSPAAQQQIEKLAEQNRKLQDDNQKMQDELTKWHAYYAAQISARPAPAIPVDPAPQPAAQPATQPAASAASPNAGYTFAQSSGRTASSPPSNNRPAPPAATHSRTHVIAPGETLGIIARKAGVSLAALEAANPGVNSRHLRRGQTINLPPP